MYAAANTPTCIRRGQSNQNLDGAQTTYCDPYGGFNSISTIPASSNDQNVIESLPQKSTVALVVRSDALSFFQSMATGTSHVGVSFVMQLAVAKAINIDKVLDFTLIDWITLKFFRYSTAEILKISAVEYRLNTQSISKVWDFWSFNNWKTLRFDLRQLLDIFVRRISGLFYIFR